MDLQPPTHHLELLMTSDPPHSHPHPALPALPAHGDHESLILCLFLPIRLLQSELFSSLIDASAPLCCSSSTVPAQQSPKADEQHCNLPGPLFVPWLLRPLQHHGLQRRSAHQFLDLSTVSSLTVSKPAAQPSGAFLLLL